MRALAPALAFALALLPGALAAPEQVHLGIRDADAYAGYTVSWVNTLPTDPATVTFHGPDGDVELGGTRVDGPTIGFVYEATLPPLAPGDNASYTIGGRDFELRLPAKDAALRIVALGDMGTTREAGDAVETVKGAAPSMVLHLGDVSYAGGDPVTWKAWFDLVEPVASQVPWIPALGNHEGDVQGLSRDEASVVDPVEQAFFTQRFPLPADTFWYSFDVGPVHFIALDTFSELVMPETEIAWLEADLAAATDATWLVAYLHEPPYSSNANHGSSPRAYDAFAELLESKGVDLVLTGHDHSYERSYSMRAGKVVGRDNATREGNGTVYVVTGGGGASLYEEFLDPQPEWSAVREAVHHVLVLDITEERIEARAVRSGDGTTADTFSIEKPAPIVPPTSATPLPAWVAIVASVALAFGSRRRRSRLKE